MLIQDKTFKFYLKNTQGLYYSVSNGVVSLAPNKTDLGEIISSWRDIEVGIDRDLENMGTLKKYSLDLEFVLNGAIILKHIAYTKGLIGLVILEVDKLDTFTETYGLWVELEVDLTTFNADDVKVSANAKEGGLRGLLNNRKDVEYKIDIGNDALNMRIDGALVRSSSFWTTGSSNRADGTANTIQYAGTSRIGTLHISNVFAPITWSSSNVIEGQFIIPSSTELVTNQNVLGSDATPVIPASRRRTPIATTTNIWRNTRVRGIFDFSYSTEPMSGSATITSGVASLYLVIVNKNNPTIPNQQSYLLGATAIDTSGNWNNYVITYDRTIPLIAEDCMIYFVVQFKSESTADNLMHQVQIWYDNSRHYMYFKSRVPATNAKGYRYIDLIHKLVNKMTDGKYIAQSNFLSQNFSQTQRNLNFDSKPRNVIITSGLGIRGLSNPYIKTKWSDVLKDLMSLYNIVPTYQDGIIRLEPMTTSFSNEVIFETQEVADLNVSMLSEKAFNQVKVGQKEVSNDNIDGLNEFNTTLSFLVKENTIREGVLDLVSPFRADVYGIESARADTFNEDKKDTSFDNEVWLIEVADTPTNGIYQPYRINANHISGVDDPQGIYNITLSPKRRLLRNMSYIKSMYSEGVLEFVATDKNPSLVSNLSTPYIVAKTIAETSNENLSADVFYNVDKNRIFTPFIIEFNCSSDYNLVELTNHNMNGLVAFKHNDAWYKGWILDVGCKPSTRDSYTFRLISHKDNNLIELTK